MTVTTQPAKESPEEWMRRTERTSLLRFASEITSSPGSPALVTAMAQDLEFWLDAATSDHDRRNRMDAMHRVYWNLGPGADDADQPAAFLAAARYYYDEFLTGER